MKIEKEILFQSDLERLIGKRPFAAQTTYQKFTNGQPSEEKKEEPKPASTEAGDSSETNIPTEKESAEASKDSENKSS